MFSIYYVDWTVALASVRRLSI